MERWFSPERGVEEMSDASLRRIRAVCVRCGADVQAIEGRATIGGSCATCGGHELVAAPAPGPG